jgi:hypothetical protein
MCCCCDLLSCTALISNIDVLLSCTAVVDCRRVLLTCTPVVDCCRCLQPELLGEVLEMLRGSAALHGGSAGGAGSSVALQVEQICSVMRQWGQNNGLL